jgi:hypothetical protein
MAARVQLEECITALGTPFGNAAAMLTSTRPLETLGKASCAKERVPSAHPFPFRYLRERDGRLKTNSPSEERFLPQAFGSNVQVQTRPGGNG